MTLHELVNCLRVPPEKGAHEIVRAPDNMYHLAVILMAHDKVENGHRMREFAFTLWCNISSVKAGDLIVERDASINCLQCIQWRST